MKILNPIFPFLPLLIGILFGCDQHAKETDLEAEKDAIRAIYEEYCQRVSAREFEAFVELWSDDAIRMEPNLLTMAGKDALRERFKTLWEPANHKMKLYGETEVEVRDDLAFARGAVVLSSVFKETGDTTYIDIKFLDILKKQTDGTWKIYIDCFNLNPVWSGDSIPKELLDRENPYY